MSNNTKNDLADWLRIQPTFSFGLSKDVHDLCLGRILAQSPDQVATLGVSDFHLAGWRPVKQLESIFEVWTNKKKLIILCLFSGHYD